METYKQITGKYNRVFVVGDIHGEITKFNQKLIDINFDKETDLMISVGDLIDRGEDSVACLRLINEPWFECVRGNHEQMAFDALNNKSPESAAHWIMNGGDWYASLDQKKTNEVNALIQQISELPIVIEIEFHGNKTVICHADHYSDSYQLNKLISIDECILDRQRYTDSKAGHEDYIKGADLFVFGHTPVNKPERYKNQLYIDTGAVFGRELTVIEL